MAVPNWDAYNTSIEKCRQDQFKQLEGTYETHRGIDAGTMLAIVVQTAIFFSCSLFSRAPGINHMRMVCVSPCVSVDSQSSFATEPQLARHTYFA